MGEKKDMGGFKRSTWENCLPPRMDHHLPMLAVEAWEEMS